MNKRISPLGTMRHSLGSLAAILFVGSTLLASPFLRAGPADMQVESPVDGKVFRLVDARGKWVVLHFLLKTECPFCLKHTQEYVKNIERWDDVTHVFLKPDSAEAIRGWAMRLDETTRKRTPLYRDPDARWAKVFEIPGGYRFHGLTVHYPALVVLNPDGKEVFRHVGKDNSDRFSFEDFKARLPEWKRARSAAGGAKPAREGL